MSASFAVPQVTGQPLWFLNNLAVIHASSHDTGGAYGLVEITGAPGDMPPLHVHRNDDEGFYILTGRLRLHVGANDPVELGAGEFVLAPRGVPHTYQVISDEPATWLGTTSDGFDLFVADVAGPADSHTLPQNPALPAPEVLGRIAATHGIDILGPPGTLPS